MRKAAALFVLLLWVLTSGAPELLAKGLGELSEKNPEADDNGESDSHVEAPPVTQLEGGGQGDAAKDSEESDKVTPVVSGFSKMLSGKVSLASSVGWAKVSQPGGAWKSSGYSDFGLNYQISAINEATKFWVSYRFVPVVVSGLVNGHSYRGVWETHNIGGQVKLKTSLKTVAIGSGELGFLKSHLHPTDGLAAEGAASKGGAVFALGGGMDYWVLNRSEFTIGPRLYLGLGAASQLQLSLSCGFGF
jgi:hypothetical protein